VNALDNFPPAQMIDVNGVTLEVFSAGAPSGSTPRKPLVLCHGWPEHAFSWRHQINVLVDAGYHVIAPNQRGYGNSSVPSEVTDYDIHHLTSDLAALLDHYGYDDAVFVGHDWGAIIVWNMALLQPHRVQGVINLSVPFMERGTSEWVGFWEKMLGGDFYIVHFNRQPGVADAVFAANSKQFLTNLYRTEQWLDAPQDLGPGMNMINMAQTSETRGKLIMSEAELQVFVDAFATSTYTGGLNWYRNFTRNWETTSEIEQKVQQQALMIYGQHDMVPPAANLADFVPNVEVATLDCGHWIQQEKPEETNRLMLNWLSKHYPSGS